MAKLLGDLTADALNAIGAAKLADFYQRTTGRPCNCASRRQILNNLHRAAQRAFERQQKVLTTQQRAQLRPPLETTEDKTEQQAVHQSPTKPVDEQ